MCSLRDATHASTFLTKSRSASKHSLIIEKLSALVSGSRWENCCSCSRSVFVIGYRTDRKTSIAHTADLHGCLVVTRRRSDSKTKAPASFEVGAFNLNPAASYSSIRRPYSTIGAGGLNGRVRDGIGCDTSAIATGNFRDVLSQLNTGTTN